MAKRMSAGSPAVYASSPRRIDAVRDAVLCIDATKEFEKALEAGNLQAISIYGDGIEAVRTAARELSGCRGIAIFVGPLAERVVEQQRLRKILNAVVGPALKSALMIAVIVDGDSSDIVRASSILSTTNFMPTSLPSQTFGASVYPLKDEASVLRSFLQHSPGPGWRDLPIDTDDLVGDDDRILIQRAFSDCDRIALKRISGKSVYRVDAERSPQPHPVPFLVKLNTMKKIDKERGNIEELCADRMPFPYVPPMISQRYAQGTRRAAIVSHFVERAVLLADYIRTNNANRVIHSLFDGPLRVWRSYPIRKPYALGQYALEKGITTRSCDSYRTAFEGAKKLNAGILCPEKLLQMFDDLPAIEVNEVCSHGDLHMGNVFVRQPEEVVLIDFLRSGHAPSSRDPAELECSIAFDGGAGQQIDTPTIENIYATPLLPVRRQQGSDPRIGAICQIRRQVNDAVEPLEYQIMIAAHLLWWASARDHALAYLLAERLITDAKARRCNS